MSVAADILSNGKSFIKAATNLVGIVERNIDALFRIKKKVKLQHQLARVERMLNMFPQIMFFNGVFLTLFDKKYVMSPKDCDQFSQMRDYPVVHNFERVLDDMEKNFDADAPHIRGLGSEMVHLFKEGIALRREVLAHYHSGQLAVVKEKEAGRIRKEFAALYPMEQRLYEIRQKIEAMKKAKS